MKSLWKREIEFEIEGVAPLLMNRFHEKAQDSVQRTGKKGKKTEKDYIEEVKLKAYRDDKNNLAIPATALKTSIVNAVGDIGKLEKKKGDFMQEFKSSIFIDPLNLTLGKKEWDFIHEERGRIPPRTGGAVILRRPALKEGWKVKGKVLVSDENLSSDFIKQAVDRAGFKHGLLDHRPDYGRFVVTKWKANGGN